MHTRHSIIASASKRATPEPLRLTKAAIAICAALLSSFCLGDIPWSDPVISSAPRPVKCVFYTFASPSINSVATSTISGIGSLDELALYYKNMPFGVAVVKGSASISYPVQNSTTNNNQSFNYSVCCSVSQGTVNSYIQKWFSPRSFSSISSVYDFAALLYYSGYSGPGIVPVGEDGSRFYFNFDYRSAVADVLCSTNTVYRSLVLSHLSTVSGTLVNIGSSVGTINNDYRSVNDSYLNPSYSNIAARAAYYNGLGGYGLFLENYLPDHPEQAPEIAKAVLENARKNIGYVLNACRDPDSPFYGSSLEDILNDPEDFEKAISAGGGGSVLSQFVNDPQRATRAGENFNKGINDRLDGITSALVGSQGSDAPSIMGILGGGGSGGGGGLAGDIKRLSTNDWASAVTNQLAENTAGITNRLAQNTLDIKDALANMFGPATNDVHQVREDVHDNLENIKNYNERSAQATESIDRYLREDRIKVEVDGINVGFVLEEPVTIEQTQFNGVSLPLAGISQRLEDWQAQWLHWYDYDDESRHWINYYDMVSRIESCITNLVSTNDFQRYYFDRFKQADNFTDKDEQSFKIDDACDLVFGNGFDIGEYNKLNWFSRVELLLYKVSSVTNTLETTDITSITNEVNTLNLNVTNFVNTSVKVVGVFKLIDGFAKSMRSAFSGYSSPQTSGVVLLEAGHWIGDEALVLKVPVEVQNALRLVFECIWYLSAFVVGWRILVWSWDKIVSLMRWLWSLIDI